MAKWRGMKGYAYKPQKPGYRLHNFLDDGLKSFGNKRFVLGISILIIILGGAVLYYSPGDPLFHSYTAGSVTGNDPFNSIWSPTCPNCSGGSINGFDTFASNNGGGNTWVTTGNCAGPALLGCLDQGSDTTFTSIAVSNATVGDLSISTGKELHFNFRFFIPGLGSLNSNVPWGYFLTSNNTAPATANYQPQNDRSVIFNERFTCISACNTNSPQIQFNTYLLRNQGQDTISSEDAGCTSGSVFLCASHTEALAASNLIVSNIALNFTGSVSNANNCSGTTGSGCSDSALSYNTETDANTMVIPIQSLLNSQLYFGFYVAKGLNSDIRWGWPQFSNSVAFGITYYVPSPTVAIQPANIDTGGFFGPIIKALISIGVFILSNIISFGTYISNLMGPVWNYLGSLANGVVSVVSGFIIGVLNTLGSLFGDASLGTQLSTLFASVGNIISGVLSTVTMIISDLITFLEKGFTFLFDSVNGFITFWIGILFGFLDVLAQISGIIVQVLTVFKVGFPFMVLADLIWLLTEVVDNDTEGAIRWWNIHEILFVNVGKLLWTITIGISTLIYNAVSSIEQGAADVKPEVLGFSV